MSISAFIKSVKDQVTFGPAQSQERQLLERAKLRELFADELAKHDRFAETHCGRRRVANAA